MKREFEKVQCPGCGSNVSAYVPHMGDGTGLRMVRHNVLTYSSVDSTRQSSPCPASDRIVVSDSGTWHLEA